MVSFYDCHSYLAPEYLLHGIVDEKTDVFAFGVLLLELVSGRRALDYSQQSLVLWVQYLNTFTRKFHPSAYGLNLVTLHFLTFFLPTKFQAKPLLKKNDIMELVDPSLAGDFDSRQMNLMLLAASLCIQQSSIRRPSIRQARSTFFFSKISTWIFFLS